jgi:hypothetical protein
MDVLEVNPSNYNLIKKSSSNQNRLLVLVFPRAPAAAAGNATAAPPPIVGMARESQPVLFVAAPSTPSQPPAAIHTRRSFTPLRATPPLLLERRRVTHGSGGHKKPNTEPN